VRLCSSMCVLADNARRIGERHCLEQSPHYMQRLNGQADMMMLVRELPQLWSSHASEKDRAVRPSESLCNKVVRSPLALSPVSGNTRTTCKRKGFSVRKDSSDAPTSACWTVRHRVVQLVRLCKLIKEIQVRGDLSRAEANDTIPAASR
jgi:hypothetical protein